VRSREVVVGSAVVVLIAAAAAGASESGPATAHARWGVRVCFSLKGGNANKKLGRRASPPGRRASPPRYPHALAPHPVDPTHELRMGPPRAVVAHLEAWRRLTMPETESDASAPAGSTRRLVNRSGTSGEQAHPEVTKTRASLRREEGTERCGRGVGALTPVLSLSLSLSLLPAARVGNRGPLEHPVQPRGERRALFGVAIGGRAAHRLEKHAAQGGARATGKLDGFIAAVN